MNAEEIEQIEDEEVSLEDLQAEFKSSKYASFYKNNFNLMEWAHTLKLRVRNNFDCVIAITGYNGVGKSALACALSHLMDKDFDYKKQVMFSEDSEGAIETIKSLKPYQVVWYDEAINQFLSSEWNTLSSRKFTKEYVVNRSENKIHILCVPNFAKLTSYMRNERVFIWAHVIRRGLAVMMIKDTSNPVHTDPFHLKLWDKYNDKLIKRKKMTTEQDIVHQFMKMPNAYRTLIKFPKMPGKFEEKYDELKNERKRSALNEISKVDTRTNHLLWVLEAITLMRKRGLKLKDLYDGLSMGKSTIRNYYAEAGRILKKSNI
jgi:hypothetical protein